MKQKSIKDTTCQNLLNRLPVNQPGLNNRALRLLNPQFNEVALLIHGVEYDPIIDQRFLKTDFNFQIDSYKSPFTNKFFPNQNQTYYNTARVTKFEMALQESVHEFAKFTYIDPIVSCFAWEMQEKELGMVIFIQKELGKGLKHTDQYQMFMDNDNGLNNEFMINQNINGQDNGQGNDNLTEEEIKKMKEKREKALQGEESKIFENAMYIQRLQINISGQISKEMYHLVYQIQGNVQFNYEIKDDETGKLMKHSANIPYEKRKNFLLKNETLGSLKWESLLPQIGIFVEEMDGLIRQNIKNHLFGLNSNLIKEIRVKAQEEVDEVVYISQSKEEEVTKKEKFNELKKVKQGFQGLMGEFVQELDKMNIHKVKRNMKDFEVQKNTLF